MKENEIGTVNLHWDACGLCKHRIDYDSGCAFDLNFSSPEIKDDENGNYLCIKFEKAEE